MNQHKAVNAGRNLSSISNPLSRRRLLQLGGGGLAAAGLGLAGCANFTSSSSGGGDGGGAGGSTEDFVFTFWGSSNEKTAVTKAVGEFAEAKGIKPNIQNINYDNYNTKINTLLAAKNPPSAGYLTEGVAMRLGEEGKIVNVADKPGFDTFLPQAMHYFAPDKAVSMTALEITTIYHATEVTKAAGVTVPASYDSAWDWDGFVAAAEKLTKDRDGRSPSEAGFDDKNVARYGVLFGMDLGLMVSLFQGNGVELFDEAGTKCNIDSADAIEVVQKLSDLIFEHRVAPNTTQTAALGANPALQLDGGRVAMVIGGQWSLLDLATAKTPFDMGVLPVLDQPAVPVQGGANAVFAGGPHEAAALELLVQLGSPETVDLYASGLWMPLQEKYYTDEALISQWVDNDAHPASYRTAAIDPILKHATAFPSYKLKNWTEINTTLSGGLSPLLAKKGDVPAALKALAPKVTALMKGSYIDVRG